MSGLTAQVVVLLVSSCLFALCEETLNVTVKTGEDVTLPCQKDTDKTITVIEWSRPELKSDDYVFLFRDNKQCNSSQLPSFCGRVKLSDPTMKNGDASVILKNVNINDTGTYECVVVTGSSRRRRRHTDFSRFINLKVTGNTAGNTEERGDEEGGDKEGGDRDRGILTAPLLTVAVVICVVCGLVGFVLWKRQRSQQQNSDPPPAAELQTLSPPSSNHCV